MNRIWTDGSNSLKSGWCGWAYHGFINGKIVVACGYERGTNQRAELRAVVEAMRIAPTPEPIEIVSDSEYAIFSMTKFRAKWEHNDFKSANGEIVKHLDLIKSGHKLVDQLKISFKHVRGHTGDPGNELADTLSKSARAVAEGIPPEIDVFPFLKAGEFVV